MMFLQQKVTETATFLTTKLISEFPAQTSEFVRYPVK